MVWNDPIEQVLASQTSTRSRGLRRCLWAASGLLLTLLVWGGYRLWVDSQAAGYAAACEAARQRRAWPEVERDAVAWARWAPRQGRAWQYAAEAARRQGQPARAAEHLSRVPEDAVEATAALMDLSDLQFNELNRPLDGERTCRRVLAADPRNAEAHRRLVFFYTVTLQRAKLIQQARAAIRLDCAVPEIYIYLMSADWLTLTNAKDLIEYWLQADPENEHFLVARAVHFLGTQGVLGEVADVDPQGKPLPQRPEVAATQRRLDEYLLRFPKNLEVLAYAVNQACVGGDRQRVASLLAQAPEEAQDDNRFWRSKGWLHAAQDEYSEAEAAYRQALTLHPYDLQSQHELASVLRRLQRYAEVNVLEQRALLGMKFRRDIFALPNVKSAPKILLTKLVAYARDCGDAEFADHLMRRTSNLP